MKKKIALILAIIFSLGTLVLTACTDKNKGNDNNQRELDTVEQSIVGAWKSTSNGDFLTFKSDGTWVESTGASGTFRHTTYTSDDDFGRYEIISVGGSGYYYALFDIYPDRLYYIENGKRWGYLERQ